MGLTELGEAVGRGQDEQVRDPLFLHDEIGFDPRRPMWFHAECDANSVWNPATSNDRISPSSKHWKRRRRFHPLLQHDREGRLEVGAGLGFVNTAVVLAVQTSLSWQRRGVATASTMFFRVIGGTLGVGFLGAWLGHALGDCPGVTSEMINALLGPEHGVNLPADLLTGQTLALQSVLAPIFWVIAALGATFFGLSFAFPNIAMA